MAKNNKKNKFNNTNNKALPKADVEFGGENGLEQKALRAMKGQNK